MPDNSVPNTEWPHGYGFCHCGCGQRTSIAPRTIERIGHHKGQPVRFIRGHSHKGHPVPVEGRFWNRVKQGAPDECWEWTGAKKKQGYGYLRVGGKCKMAHRIAYKLTYGPTPEGTLVCHSCDNPSCCNPKHLFLGTHADNRLDCVSKNRHYPQKGKHFPAPPVRRGEACNKAKLTEVEVIQIRELYASGQYLLREIGEMFGVTAVNVFYIVHRKTWAHIK